MDRTLNENELALLQEALKRAKEENQKRWEKEETKRWADLNLPFSLSDGLSRLTKDVLNQLARNMQIKKVSHLKKQELIEELEKQIPERIKAIFDCFDDDRYHLVKKILQNKGYTYEFNLEENQVEYLFTRGLLFPGIIKGKRALVLPKEIMVAFEQIDNNGYVSRVRKNTEWIRLTHGMLYYYGTLGMSQLVTLLEKYTGVEIDFYEWISLLQESESYYGEIRSSVSGYSNYRVFDPEKVIEEHQARPALDYYPFSKEQLISAGEPDFVDRNPSYRELVSFIMKNYQISRNEADGIAEECVYATNIGDPLQNLVEYLQSRLEIDSLELLQGFVDKLVPLMNNTRQWFLKGYSPTELSKQERKNLRPLPTHISNVIDIRTRQKVGRNDPCPCGSGKKFKKCCGN